MSRKDKALVEVMHALSVALISAGNTKRDDGYDWDTACKLGRRALNRWAEYRWAGKQVLPKPKKGCING